MKKPILTMTICILLVIAAIIIFFNIPYSPLKSQFKSDVKNLLSEYEMNENDYFTEKDIENLPAPVQKYFRHCGFIGTRKMSCMSAVYNNVDFSTGRNGANLMIDYTQYNFVGKPDRLALIESSMFGVPFDGYDYYLHGQGGMKGVIGKCITIFDTRGAEMNKACLVTWLSEALIVPNAALQDFVKWSEIDENHAKAEVNYYGISVSGIFKFSDEGEMIAFTTNDRSVAENDGTFTYVPWTAECDNYKETDGILHPTQFRAVWNYDDGDYVYFNGNDIKITYLYG